ncbi:uncharacterized protein LOC126994685 [Eriocheir sinensis]|uniref:uncharacterized protein LOC126994685 n=1 Tax=Eriocheir sinensis TaxID=95602 RepID=UPI0021C9BFB6|nr:uncharacterized protein LOC126994685 [Eriocheir sinensis]
MRLAISHVGFVTLFVFVHILVTVEFFSFIRGMMTTNTIAKIPKLVDPEPHVSNLNEVYNIKVVGRQLYLFMMKIMQFYSSTHLNIPDAPCQQNENTMVHQEQDVLMRNMYSNNLKKLKEKLKNLREESKQGSEQKSIEIIEIESPENSEKEKQGSPENTEKGNTKKKKTIL